ncbi:MAG TPA: hypothetical protein VGK73_27925 [Polyangiaceae bacterium]
METPSRPADSPQVSPAPQPEKKSDRPLPRGASERPRSAESSQHMLAAISASSRAEASLSTLMRAVRDLSSGVSGAREANVLLMRELEGMADLLGSGNERQLALKNRIALLEQQLERAHFEAESERNYILDQQDVFIAALMEDHEQVLAELHRELETLRGRPSQRAMTIPELPSLAAAERTAELLGELEAAQSTVEKLLAERDRARETLLKLQAQRDEAQATVVALTRELEVARSGQSQARITDAVRQVIPASSAPPPGLRSASTLPPPESPRRPGQTPQAPLVEERPRASTPSRPRAPGLELSSREVPSRPSPPPEELRLALHPPSGSMQAVSVPAEGPRSSPRNEPAFEKRSLTPPGPTVITTGAPPPVSRPDGSLRPGGGYSMTNSVAPEHVSPSSVSRIPRR